MKPWMLFAGIVAIGVVAYLVLTGSNTSSSGVTVSQADPKSVAALYSAQSADTSANYAYLENVNNNQTTKFGDVVGLFTTQANNASAQQIASTQADQADYVAGLNASAQSQATLANKELGVANSNNALALGTLASNNATALGIEQGTNSVALTQITSAAATQVAQTQAQAQQDIAGTQASAAKSISNNNLFGSALGAIGSIFGL